MYIHIFPFGTPLCVCKIVYEKVKSMSNAYVHILYCLSIYLSIKIILYLSFLKYIEFTVKVFHE